jgi:hypothetical protein
MADALLLTLPVAAAFRTLGPQIAARYAEIAGGTPADSTALSAALAETLEGLAAAAGPDAALALRFQKRADGIEVEARCGDRSATVRQTVVPQR